MNTKSESEKCDIKQVPLSELQQQYIKHVETGAIFHVLQDTKKERNVFLRSKNSYKGLDKIKLQQGIVDGKWSTPNEHELRKHIELENAYYQELTYRLLKRVMFTQLLLELDNELMKDYSDDKYMHGLLTRCEKQFERLVKEEYPKLYAINKEMMMNFLNCIDEVVGKMAKLQVHEFVIVNKLIDDFLADPEAHTPETIELDKIDAHAE